MILDTSLFNTQYYKVRIKGEEEQSKERSSALHCVVAIEKGTFRSPLTTVANFTYISLRSLQVKSFWSWELGKCC